MNLNIKVKMSIIKMINLNIKVNIFAIKIIANF